MNTNNFPIITLVVFAVIVIFMPLISFVFLDKTRTIVIEVSNKQFTNIFIKEVLLWLVIAFFFGFLLIIFLGIFIAVNSVAESKGTEPVRFLPITIGFGITGIITFIGFWLHNYSKSKLLSTTTTN